MFHHRGDKKAPLKSSFALPTTKLKNIPCVFCGKQFFVKDFSHPKSSYLPLLLSCGHSSCDRCTARCAKEACPLCGPPPENLDSANGSLPLLNVYLMGLIGLGNFRPSYGDEQDISFSQPAVQQTKRHTIQQNHCYECGMSAFVRCHECANFFCNSCYNKVHQNFKAFSNHHFILLQNSKTNTIFECKACDEHDAVTDYYCNDCAFSSCHHCMLLRHKHHDVIPQETMNDQFQEQFEEAENKIGETLQRIHQTQKKVKKMLIFPEELQQTETIEAAINKHFAHLHGVLQMAEKRLIDKLQEGRNRITKNLKEIQQHLQNQEEELQSTLIMSASAKDIMDRINLQDIIPKLEALASVPCYLVQEPHPDSKNISFLFDTAIASTLETHCKLEIPEVSNYNLVQEDNLPEDYIREPLVPKAPSKSMDDSILSVTSVMKRTSSCQSISSRRPETRVLRQGGITIVDMCYVEHPSNFYVRPAFCRKKATDLEQMLCHFENPNNVVPSKVEQNTYYVVKSGLNEKWYRGRADAVNGDSGTYEIFDIDNGSIEHNVPLERIRSISSCLMTMPVTLINCALYDIIPRDGEWTPEAREIILQYQKAQQPVTMRIVDISAGTYYVDLCKENTTDVPLANGSLRDVLIYSGHGIQSTSDRLLQSTVQSERRFYFEDLAPETYYDVIISHVESPDCVYVQKEADHHYLIKLLADMTTYYNDRAMSDDGIIHIPEKGIPCAVAEPESSWYRGLVSDVKGSRMLEVILVDFGTIVTTKYDNIRKLHDNYMVYPTQAIKVSLADVKPVLDHWSEETKTVLSENLQHKRARLFTFEKTEGNYAVTLYIENQIDIAALLVSRGLAISTGPRSSGIVEMPMTTYNGNEKTIRVRNMRTVKAKKKKGRGTSVNDLGIEESKDPFKLPVKIIRVVSPDTIYLAQPDNEKKFQKMTTQMEKFYNRSEGLLNYSDCKIDLVCAVYSARDRSFCRGRIISMKNSEEAEVYLYDLSITETFRIADLQELNKRFWKTPIYAFKVKLAGIYPCGGSSTWPLSSCQKLEDIITANQNSKFFITKVASADREEELNVLLWVEQKKCAGPLAPLITEINCINRILVENGLALPIKQYDEKKSRVLAAELKRQISHAERGENTKSVKRIVEVIPEEKICGNDETSIENGDSVKEPVSTDEESDLSDESDSSNEETNHETVPSLPGTPTLIRNCTPSTSGTPVSGMQKITEWLPAEPIMEEVFTAQPTSLDYNCFFYVHSIRESGNILRYIETKLENEYRNTKHEARDLQWRKGEPCIAQYHANKKWYRAQVLQVLENGMIEVEFIDYGNIEECERDTLRKHLILVDIPRQGTRCKIFGLLPNEKTETWRISDLDKIHAHLIDRECEITVLKRELDHLVVSLVITYPKRRELIEYLRNELLLNVRSDFSTFESPTEDRESIMDDSADVIIEGYLTDSPSETNVDPGSEDVSKVAKMSAHESGKDENANERTGGEKGRQSAVEEIEENTDLGTENETKETKESQEFDDTKNYGGKDESYDHGSKDFIEADSVIEKLPIFVSSGDTNKTICYRDEEAYAADRVPGKSCTIDEVIITGTANFTRGFEEIQNKEQEAMNTLDCISLPNTINSNDGVIVTSTPCDFSFEADPFYWTHLKIPGDVQIVKAEVAKLGRDAAFMHILDNKNSKILSDQYRLYQETMQEMQEHAEKQPLLENIEEGAPCCAKFEDGKWYRGEVLHSESNLEGFEEFVNVRFVDFGNDTTVRSDELRTLKEEWFEAPCMSMLCKFWKITVVPAEDYGEIEDKIRRVYQYETGDGYRPRAFYVKIADRHSDAYEIELYKDEKCEELAYESLIKEGIYIRESYR